MSRTRNFFLVEKSFIQAKYPNRPSLYWKYTSDVHASNSYIKSIYVISPLHETVPGNFDNGKRTRTIHRSLLLLPLIARRPAAPVTPAAEASRRTVLRIAPRYLGVLSESPLKNFGVTSGTCCRAQAKEIAKAPLHHEALSRAIQSTWRAFSFPLKKELARFYWVSTHRGSLTTGIHRAVSPI